MDIEQCVTGINEINDDKEFMIYPNPAHGAVTLSASTSGKYLIQLSNVLGEIIDHRVEQIDKSTTLQLGSLTKGIYFIEVFNGEKRSTQKLVIE